MWRCCAGHEGEAGWVAIAPQGDCVRAVGLVRDAAQRPRVAWACSAPWDDPLRALRGLRRSRSLSGQRTVGVLQPAQYQWLTLDAPDVPREDWRDAVRWRLKDMIDFPVESAGLDILEVPADPQQRRRAALFAIAAVARDARAAGRGCEDAGLPWSAIDVAGDGPAQRRRPRRCRRSRRGAAPCRRTGQHARRRRPRRTPGFAPHRGRVRPADPCRRGGPPAARRACRAGVAAHPGQRRAPVRPRGSRPAADRAGRTALATSSPMSANSSTCRSRRSTSARALDCSSVPELADPVELAAFLPAIGAALR